MAKWTPDTFWNPVSAVWHYESGTCEADTMAYGADGRYAFGAGNADNIGHGRCNVLLGTIL